MMKDPSHLPAFPSFRSFGVIILTFSSYILFSLAFFTFSPSSTVPPFVPFFSLPYLIFLSWALFPLLSFLSPSFSLLYLLLFSFLVILHTFLSPFLQLLSPSISLILQFPFLFYLSYLTLISFPSTPLSELLSSCSFSPQWPLLPIPSSSPTLPHLQIPSGPLLTLPSASFSGNFPHLQLYLMDFVLRLLMVTFSSLTCVP